MAHGDTLTRLTREEHQLRPLGKKRGEEKEEGEEAEAEEEDDTPEEEEDAEAADSAGFASPRARRCSAPSLALMLCQRSVGNCVKRPVVAYSPCSVLSVGYAAARRRSIASTTRTSPPPSAPCCSKRTKRSPACVEYAPRRAPRCGGRRSVRGRAKGVSTYVRLYAVRRRRWSCGGGSTRRTRAQRKGGRRRTETARVSLRFRTVRNHGEGALEEDSKRVVVVLLFEKRSVPHDVRRLRLELL